MGFIKSIKRVARNIAAKNHRRSTRVKGTSRKQSMFEGKMNIAQTLVLAWTGPSRRTSGLGVSDANVRAAKRLVEHKAQWLKTPVLRVANSRQVMRRAQIVVEKAGRTVNVSGISLDWCIGRSKSKVPA